MIARMCLRLCMWGTLAMLSAGCQAGDSLAPTGDLDSEAEVCGDGVSRPVGWTAESHCKGEDADYDLVFDDSQVRRLDITVGASDYQASMDDLEDILAGDQGGPGGGSLDDTTDPMYVPVTVGFNGSTWEHVGMRYKGNSSLHFSWMDGILKLSFRFNFDKYEDEHPDTKNQRFYGFKKMTFSNGFKDSSLIRDKVAADLFRAAGVPAARGTFVRVYLDHGDGPVYMGLYTMIEDPSDEMLENQFADDSGNLYKPEGEAATWSFFEEESFDKKTNEDEADWSDIIAAVDALNENTTNASQWRSNLEEVFNVEAFLRCLAVNQVIVNWDSYGVMDHNYYVYGDPSDNGRLAWFPWDLNESMLLTGMNSSVASSIMLDDIEDEWPLIRYLLDDEVYREAYLEEVKAFLDGPFDTALVHEQLDAAHNLIAPYVVGTEATEAEPYTFLRNAAEFEDSLTDNREGLKPHVEERYEYARSILASE